MMPFLDVYEASSLLLIAIYHVIAIINAAFNLSINFIMIFNILAFAFPRHHIFRR